VYQVTITYGQPDDAEAFERYYRDNHLPLAARIPGLQALAAGRCFAPDGEPVSAYLVTTLTFESEAEARAGLASTEGQAAAADIANFATGGATITHVPVEYSIS
jgi:uncharacterized protein (TIGR02118 family)